MKFSTTSLESGQIWQATIFAKDVSVVVEIFSKRQFVSGKCKFPTKCHKIGIDIKNWSFPPLPSFQKEEKTFNPELPIKTLKVL